MRLDLKSSQRISWIGTKNPLLLQVKCHSAKNEVFIKYKFITLLTFA